MERQKVSCLGRMEDVWSREAAAGEKEKGAGCLPQDGEREKMGRNVIWCLEGAEEVEGPIWGC